jgi:hypothetical protein
MIEDDVRNSNRLLGVCYRLFYCVTSHSSQKPEEKKWEQLFHGNQNTDVEHGTCSTGSVTDLFWRDGRSLV